MAGKGEHVIIWVPTQQQPDPNKPNQQQGILVTPLPPEVIVAINVATWYENFKQPVFIGQPKENGSGAHIVRDLPPAAARAVDAAFRRLAEYVKPRKA